MKNLRTLFVNLTSCYVYEDDTFQKGFDGGPCPKTLTKIKLLRHHLDLVYKRKTKEQPGELFCRKTKEAETMPNFESVVACLDEIKASILKYLDDIEKAFGNKGKVSVWSEKSGSTDEKQVCFSCASRSA